MTTSPRSHYRNPARLCITRDSGPGDTSPGHQSSFGKSGKKIKYRLPGQTLCVLPSYYTVSCRKFGSSAVTDFRGSNVLPSFAMVPLVCAVPSFIWVSNRKALSQSALRVTPVPKGKMVIYYATGPFYQHICIHILEYMFRVTTILNCRTGENSYALLRFTVRSVFR